MPIRKDLRHLYRTAEYKAARARVVERAGNRCEQCGKPNGEKVETVTYNIDGPAMFWRSAGSGWIDHTGRANALPAGWPWISIIRVVCTCAHLNHTAGDDRDENLKFLCQWCHLNLDKPQHKITRSIRKDQARPLLSA